jgi:Icc-related predicted phosphoesterase
MRRHDEDRLHRRPAREPGRDSGLRSAADRRRRLLRGQGRSGAKQAFLVGAFKEWLESVPTAAVVLVAGNHDQSIQAWGLPGGLRCHYLEDSGADLFGLKLWGTPWQPWFNDWAFNAPRRYSEAFLASKFELIPADADIVICHGPPRGFGDHDGSEDEQSNVGSTALTQALERVQPRLAVCGHIHSGYGRYRLGAPEVVNASRVDNAYRPVHDPIEITL